MADFSSEFLESELCLASKMLKVKLCKLYCCLGEFFVNMDSNDP